MDQYPKRHNYKMPAQFSSPPPSSSFGKEPGKLIPRIAISYRRSDSTAIAGRIADRLTARYGRNTIFIDVDNVPLGTDFRKHIQEVWSKIAVLIVVIGPNWLGVAPSAAVGRIYDRRDPVRIEVETALGRDITVIPILVDGASMPSAVQLPKSLRAFADRNAAKVDGGQDFHTHMQRLILAIDATLGIGVEERADLPTFRDRASAAAMEPRATLQRRSPSAAQLLLRDLITPIFVLVALQHVIVNALDLDTIYLRITSFVVPFAFGVFSSWHARRDILGSLAMGTGIGLLAVAAMTIVTGVSSGQRILPATAFEWRESIEYVVSIAASFFAGCLAARLKFSLLGKNAGSS
jgi:hypothetical protein